MSVQRRPPGRLKGLLLDGAVVLGSLVFTAGALEMGLRLFGPRPEPFQLGAKGLFEDDPGTEYDFVRDFPPVEVKAFEDSPDAQLWSNSLGCYDRPYAPRGGERPVLLVGDSFTQGHHFESNWGTRLEGHIARRVLKCGLAGFGTRQELAKARKTIARMGAAPGLIVVGYYMNDLDDDYLSPARRVVDGRVATFKRVVDYATGAVRVKELPELRREVAIFERLGEVVECPSDARLQRLRCWLYAHSTLYRRVKPLLKAALLRSSGLSKKLEDAGIATPYIGRYMAWLTPQEAPWVEAAWERHLASLKGFAELAAANGSRLLVVVIPLKEHVYAPGPWDERAYERVLGYMRAQGIPALDLRRGFRQRAAGRDLYFSKDVHWNPKGNRLAALLTAERVLQERLVPVTERGRLLPAVRAALASF